VALLEVANLSFGYTNEPLFDGVTFRLEAGERAAIVAPNGAGKSTLLRLIAGELAPDRGAIQFGTDVKFGYYRQSHELKAEGSVLETLLSGFQELLALRHALSDAEREAATGTERALERLAELGDRWRLLGGDRLENRVQAIATRLGFGAADLNRPAQSLSGGERGRLGLGVVLAQEPDLLLLDEPTNHLDLETIDWLQGYLAGLRAAVLIVSHDRAFLDAACPTTMELGKRSFRAYPLAYSAYHAAREVDLERERKLAAEQAAFVAKTEDFIRKNLAGQKTNQAKSRRKMLDKLERVERPEDVWATAEKVRFRFAPAARSGDIVLEAKGLAAERGERELFSNADLLVRRGDRVAIVGANGCGKTTLLRILAGTPGASDRGSVRRGTNLLEGYFDQHLGTLDPKRTGVDEIRSVRGDLNVDAARNYLARFRFWGDDPLRRIDSLSGGERTRLAMAKLLLEPRNLLFLDEPTNHLDLPATEILEEALLGFEGTLIFVSHDRRLLETVSTRTVAFTSSGIDVYEGGFADYVAALARQRAAREPRVAPPAPRPAKAQQPPPADSTAAAAERHAARRAAQREIEKKRRRVTELETAIATAEAELARLRGKLRDGAGEDWEKLHDWARQEQAESKKLDRLMAEWVALSEELTKHDALAQEPVP
jgi:ATP-binding cassette subfamily F protein 3